MRLSSGSRDVMDALNEVDWSNHGFDVDYEVTVLESTSKGVRIVVMNLETYEPEGAALSGMEDEFQSVLDAAGVEDDR